jgi:sulfite reductase (ferredoxin)
MVNTQVLNADRKPSKVEGIKERSHFLREPVASELLLDTDHFTEEAVQLLKFHGSYQQTDREQRVVPGQGKAYSMMLRTRSPGGFIPPELYLTLDRLCDEYGNHTIRATTRQGFQLHGILKKNLKATIAAIVSSLGSTLGACGDLNRNVMSPAAPYRNRPEYALASEYANRIADLLTPQTGAYYEVWLDGEKAISGERHPDVVAALQRNGNGTTVSGGEEPIYGTHYMPRKFKCAVTVPGDNSVDLFSQDVSLVVITNAAGELQGFNIYAGGGLGRTHNKEGTFPRIADPIGYVDHADVYDVMKAIVATQRDYGDRSDRRHARMKYLIEDWGVEKFRTQVEQYFGKSLQPMQPTPEWQYLDFLDWQEQGDGKLFVGLSVQNGRVKDAGEFRLKTALKEIVQTFHLPMIVTPSQDIVLYDIEPSQKAAVQAILTRCGVKAVDELDSLVRYSMACPALPTCALATAESERVIPAILERIRANLVKVGLPEEHFIIRMTGCPNGCARPYLAELGFVGNGPDQYQIWLGAAPNQARLSRVYLEKMPIAQLEATFEPIFVYFKQGRQSGESFGDFCDRVGLDSLHKFSETYVLGDGMLEDNVPEKSVLEDNAPAASVVATNGTATSASATVAAPAVDAGTPVNDGSVAVEKPKSAKLRHRVDVRNDLYDRAKVVAGQQGKPLPQLVNEVIEAYLQGVKDEVQG